MKISWLQRLLSYFIVITIKKINSKYNPGLCLQLEAGKLLLNTSNANYSYGNLHKIFEEIFRKIYLKLLNPKKVLLLGLGAGSVIDIFQKNYKLFPKIKAVEIDPEIISAISNWTNINLEKTEIICDNASKFVQNENEKYDLIIVDLFNDLDMPEFIYTADFSLKLKNLMNEKSIIIINCIVNSKLKKAAFDEYKILLSRYFNSIKIHEIMGMNKVVELTNH